MDSVAPLPTGGGVTVIAEHRGRREQEGRSQDDGKDKAAAVEPVHPAASRASVANEAPSPIAEEELVPAETLFAASLMANAAPPAPSAAEEMRRRAERGWTPPDSTLRLKDKLI
jgi:hypothetical protein